MKLGLFILSLIGFAASAYNLSTELQGESNNGHLIYVFLLAVLLCNCAVGLIMTYPEAFPAKRRLKITYKRYAIKK